MMLWRWTFEFESSFCSGLTSSTLAKAGMIAPRSMTFFVGVGCTSEVKSHPATSYAAMFSYGLEFENSTP
jgi:hypothetical protein